MSKWRICDTHDNQYDEDDGCLYCYEEWKGKQALIKEFLEKILAFNYVIPAEPQIISIREWLEGKLNK